MKITTSSLPVGVIGTPYSAAVGIDGGSGPYTWSSPGGGLPPGLALSSSDGEITGTPTTSGTYQFPVQVTDEGNPQDPPAFADLTISVSSTASQSLQITTSGLPPGTVGQVYPTTVLAAANGNPPYTWKLVKGTGKLPKGLKLKDGVISGTPSKKSETSTFTVEVLDTKTMTKPKTQNTATATFTITIEPAAGN